MYVEPTWIELLLKSSALYIAEILCIILILYVIYKISNKFVKKKMNVEAIVISSLIILIICGVLASGILWNEWMEKPSVRTAQVTITGIQPAPGMVKLNADGYVISNSDQLMFTTKEGLDFKNIERWEFSKFETRSIFNQLRVNGTYRIKYYGWRNGHSNEFPNILSVEEVIDENNTSPNDFNAWFGSHRGLKDYTVEMK